MSSQDIFFVVRMLVNCAFPTALLFCMCRFRYPRKWVRLAYLLLTCVTTLISSIFYFTAGQETMMQSFSMILLLPSITYLFFAAKEKASQLFFSFFTAVNALFLISILSRILLVMREDLIWLEALIRALFFSILLFLFHRYLSSAYQYLVDHMKRGWGVIAVIPFLFFVFVLYLGLYPHVRTDHFAAVLFLYVILCFVYYIIYRVFRSTYELCSSRKTASIPRKTRRCTSRPRRYVTARSRCVCTVMTCVTI